MRHRRILITGVAGFIGFHVARRLLREGYNVTGIDNINPYYDVQLKRDRVALLQAFPTFTWIEGDIGSPDMLDAAFQQPPEIILHFAAQAGVRYSLEQPLTYIENNVVAFTRLLEACRRYPPEHLVFASSSSVYGGIQDVPFREEQCTEFPVSVYAATKKADELLAHTYSHLFGIPTTGIRLFTVYGPWGRPDMAYFLFTKAILEGQPIRIYNQGQMKRDFTYIDDVVEAIVRLLPRAPEPEVHPQAPTGAPYRVYNLGSDRPVRLGDFVHELERLLGKEAEKQWLPLQPGDIPETWADVSRLEAVIGFRPSTELSEGLRAFVAWYLDYYAHRPSTEVIPSEKVRP